MLEHDDDDRYLTKEYFMSKVNMQVQFVANTDDLFDALQHCSTTGEFPSLILLNQSSGPMEVLELLRSLKSSPQLKHIPVIILCGNVPESQVKDLYAAGVSSIIQKPVTHHDTEYRIANFIRYWFDTVVLP
jgi:CheY-like chemotaxis protein